MIIVYNRLLNNRLEQETYLAQQSSNNGLQQNKKIKSILSMKNERLDIELNSAIFEIFIFLRCIRPIKNFF